MLIERWAVLFRCRCFRQPKVSPATSKLSAKENSSCTGAIAIYELQTSAKSTRKLGGRVIRSRAAKNVRDSDFRMGKIKVAYAQVLWSYLIKLGEELEFHSNGISTDFGCYFCWKLVTKIFFKHKIF